LFILGTVNWRITVYQIIERCPRDLVPYSANARTHSPAQISQIASSIKEYGFTNPVLVDANSGVIAGHGRLLAAKELGLDTVPTLCLGDLTETQKKAYIIADNRIALNADWDMGLLQQEVMNLQALEFDLDLLFFEQAEIDKLLGTGKGLVDEDAAPTPPETAVSELGDLWVLGGHRVLCGDSTDTAALASLMGDDRADLIFTDPPYGMEYGGGRAAGSTEKGARVKAHGPILGDNLQGDSLVGLIQTALSTAREVTKGGAGAYVCFTWRTYAQFQAALEDFDVKACIVWDKQSIGLGQSKYRPQHEFIFYCDGPWYGDKAQSDVWKMSRGATGEYVHPTQKPVELIERALGNSSKRGDIILDSFGGSGSTLIACEKTSRSARLVELDPKYVDVIVQRWQTYTGLGALNSDGETFDQVKTMRD